MATSVKQMVDLRQLAADAGRQATKAKGAAEAALQQSQEARRFATEKADAKTKAEGVLAAAQVALQRTIDAEKAAKDGTNQRLAESNASAQSLQNARDREAEKKTALDAATGAGKTKAQADYDKATEDVKTSEDKNTDAQNKLTTATTAATNAEKDTAAKRSTAETAKIDAQRALKESSDAEANAIAKQAEADRAQQAYNDAAQKAAILQAAADTCGCGDEPTPSEDCKPSLCLTFFDVQAANQIVFVDNPVPLIVQYTDDSGPQQDSVNANKVGSGPQYQVDLSDLDSLTEGTLVSLSLGKRETVNCTIYTSDPVEFPFTCNPCNVCACLEMPLIAQPATFTMEFKAYENSMTDPDDETLVDGVGIVVTPVEVGTSKKGKVTLGRSYTRTTKGGYAVIAGLPQRQLFEIRFATPNPYLSLAPRRIYGVRGFGSGTDPVGTSK
jgi:hypothetical protein